MKIIAVSLIISGSAWGQTITLGTTTIASHEVTSDTINNSPNKDFENSINLWPIDSSSYDFEIRFYRSTAVTTNRILRIVRYAHDQWEAVEFEEKGKSNIQRHVLVPTQGFETFLTNLIEQNFATLPDQNQVEKKIEASFASRKEYLQSRPGIMDGYQFTIEFKLDNKFRVYQFENPESYTRYYDNVPEFRNYISIQKIFERDLVRAKNQ